MIKLDFDDVASISYIISSDDALDLLAADRTLSDRLIRWLVEDSPSRARLAHDAMAAVEEDCVDLSTEANVAVVERFLLLL